MKTIILCAKCKGELLIVDVRPAHTIHEVEISVKQCENCENEPNELDCSQCEDLEIQQKRAEEAEAKLKYLKKLLNENKSAQDEPAEPELDTNIKNLQPTPDIVSTGGAIIPGIKKGSAEGVKADYGKNKL